jgi:hypothetical protein
MNVIGRLACWLGVHKWVSERNPENAATYLKCDRCRKEKDSTSITGVGF